MGCAESRTQYGRDVFLHEKHIGVGNLKMGARVKFKITLNKDGKPYADPVELLDSGDICDGPTPDPVEDKAERLAESSDISGAGPTACSSKAAPSAPPSMQMAENRQFPCKANNFQRLPPLREALIGNSSDLIYEDKSDQTEYLGVIRLVADNSKYAFINCSESRAKYGRDIFLHERNVGAGCLIVGQKVKFRVVLNTRRQPYADPCEVVESEEGLSSRVTPTGAGSITFDSSGRDDDRGGWDGFNEFSGGGSSQSSGRRDGEGSWNQDSGSRSAGDGEWDTFGMSCAPPATSAPTDATVEQGGSAEAIWAKMGMSRPALDLLGPDWRPTKRQRIGE